jgi:hypothetical protein
MGVADSGRHGARAMVAAVGLLTAVATVLTSEGTMPAWP